MSFARPRWLTAAALLLILTSAAALRLHGLDWDSGQHLHPDERFLAIVGSAIHFPSDPLAYFDTRRSPLNPYNQGQDGFAYGTAPLFLTRWIADRVGMASYDQISMVGRRLSALADVGTVLLVFLLGRFVYGTRVGLLGAALLAVTVLDIQLSHFFAVDTFLAFSTTLALYAAYRAWYGGSYRSFALLGFAAGLALATKLSAALLAPVILLAAVVPPPNDRQPRPWIDRALGLAVCGAVALLVYRVGEPYSFAATSFFGFAPNPQRFTDLDRWVKISSGEIEVPFMIQWANTPNPWFALDNLIRWGFGPAAGLSGLVGLAIAAVQLRWWPRHGRHLLLVAWAGINLTYFGFQFAKFLRYFLPAYPALALLGAWLLVWLGTTVAARVDRPLRTVCRLAGPAVLAATTVYALMFSTIYDRPNTRIAASEWIFQHVPAGSTLGVEHWDDALPLRLPGYDTRYGDVSMTLYDEETPEKARKLSSSLDQADYLILSSNRLYGSIPRLPQRYPMAVEYYRALFDGRLGFDLVARFDSQPELFGLTVDSSRAQEDFTVYDHPTVLIFKKTDRYSSRAVASLLGSVPLDTVERIKPVEASARHGLMLSSGEWQRVQASGTWSHEFALGGLAAQLAIPLWLLAVVVVGAAAFPLCWWLFPALADRGYAASRVVGLVLVSYIGWLAASVGVATWGRGLVFASLALLVAAGALVGWRNRHALAADVRARWRAMALVDAVFVVAFALMLAIRMVNPDLWHPSFGGEKPMDFAFLNAVVKTPSFPPYDPWFSGGYINYYYYGFVLVAALIHLTGVPPAIAYNLAIPTVYALTAATACAVGASLLARKPDLGRYGLASLAGAGGASAVALLVLGNLDGAVQILEGLWKLGGDGIQSGLPLLTGLTKAIAGVVTLVFGGGRLPAFDFWRSTRFIGPEDPGPIHEFPFFTFLYGDLHAHMLSLPLQVTTVLVLLQLVRLPMSEALAWRGLGAPETRRCALRMLDRPAALLMLAGLLIGMMRATNTWELPTYLALTGLALFVAVGAGRTTRLAPAVVAAGVGAAATYAAASVLFWPYLSRYELFYSGFVPVKTQTNPGQFLLINGLLLFVLASFLALAVARAWVAVRPVSARLSPSRAAAPSSSYGALIAPAVNLGADVRIVTLVALALAFSWALSLRGFGTLGILALVGALLAALALLRQGSRETLFACAVSAAAIGALALPEVVAVKGDVGRMNTVFKFYLQAWVLLSLLAGPLAVFAVRWLRDRRTELGIGPGWRWAWSAALALLVLGAAIYPLLGTPTKVRLRFAQLPPTLDGMAYMDEAPYTDKDRDLDLPADAAAIRWMLDNVEGTPVILEGNAPLYHWGARFSIYTGLPTVIGWDWHEKQQRAAYGDRVDQRLRDVALAYQSPNPEAAWQIIQRYGVRYIVVGGLERAYYPPAGLDKFDIMVGDRLDVAYREDGVTIYRVRGS